MFFRCPKPQGEGQCPFFQWEDEPPRASPGGAKLGNGSSAGGPSPGSNPSGNPNTTCFKCGKVLTLPLALRVHLVSCSSLFRLPNRLV